MSDNGFNINEIYELYLNAFTEFKNHRSHVAVDPIYNSKLYLIRRSDIDLAIKKNKGKFLGGLANTETLEVIENLTQESVGAELKREVAEIKSSLPSNNLIIAIQSEDKGVDEVIHVSNGYGKDLQVATSFSKRSDDYSDSKSSMQELLNSLNGFYLTSAFIKSLQEKELYVGEKNSSVKNRSGKEKVLPIVYVTNKKNLAEYKKELGDGVDWKHSWECVGHWRSCSAVGKDRNGEYNQVGRTWVNPCVKGKGELVKKIRVVLPRSVDSINCEVTV